MRPLAATLALLLAFAALSWLAACPSSVTTAESFDAGAEADADAALPSCAGLSVCDEHGDCAGEQVCGSEWCWADKGYPAHWCVDAGP